MTTFAIAITIWVGLASFMIAGTLLMCWLATR